MSLLNHNTVSKAQIGLSLPFTNKVMVCANIFNNKGVIMTKAKQAKRLKRQKSKRKILNMRSNGLSFEKKQVIRNRKEKFAGLKASMPNFIKEK